MTFFTALSFLTAADFVVVIGGALVSAVFGVILGHIVCSLVR